MQTQDPLAQLRDIHLPNAISAWPPAPGWWILTLLIIMLIVAGSLMYYHYYQRNRYRRQAYKMLLNLDSYQQNNDCAGYIQQLNALLKQTALAANAQQDIASLSGQQWLQFLDRSANTQDFSQGVGNILLDGPYRPTIHALNIAELKQLSERWIKRHRLPC